MAVLMVWALCAALTPGATCSVASIETVKLVSCCDRLSRTIRGKFRRLALSGVIGMQIRPQASVAKKLIISGVAFSAAIMRSPSFSRSSSSIRITIRPALMSSSRVGMSLSMSVLRVMDLNQLDGHCRRFTAANTQCGHAPLFTVVLQRMHQRNNDA